MSDKSNNPPDKNIDRLKNPSPIGTQQNVVSSPMEKTNPVKEDLDEREKVQRENEARSAKQAE